MNRKYPSDVEVTSHDDSGSQGITAEWSPNELPSTVVIEKVSSISERDPLKMPPLYDAIDTEALDTLLVGAAENGVSDVQVSFEYDGFSVYINSTGHVSIE